MPGNHWKFRTLERAGPGALPGRIVDVVGCAGWGGFSIPLKQPKRDEVGVDFISRIVGNWIHSKWGALEFPDSTRKVHSVGEYESLTYQKVL